MYVQERKQATYGNVSTSFGVVLTQELEVLAILKGGGGGAHKFSQRGDAKSFTILKWGCSMLQTHDIPFCSPLPVINKSMVSLVLRQYMRGENGTEFSGLFFSVLLIRIGKQNVKIIEK